MHLYARERGILYLKILTLMRTATLWDLMVVVVVVVVLTKNCDSSCIQFFVQFRNFDTDLLFFSESLSILLSVSSTWLIVFVSCSFTCTAQWLSLISIKLAGLIEIFQAIKKGLPMKTLMLSNFCVEEMKMKSSAFCLEISMQILISKMRYHASNFQITSTASKPLCIIASRMSATNFTS